MNAPLGSGAPPRRSVDRSSGEGPPFPAIRSRTGQPARLRTAPRVRRQAAVHILRPMASHTYRRNHDPDRGGRCAPSVSNSGVLVQPTDPVESGVADRLIRLLGPAPRASSTGCRRCRREERSSPSAGRAPRVSSTATWIPGPRGIKGPTTSLPKPPAVTSGGNPARNGVVTVRARHVGPGC